MSVDYERAILDELEAWPGVSASFSHRAKHRQVTFRYNGATRFVIFPDTPGDSQRGHLNNIADARKESRALGAERIKRAKSPRRPTTKRHPRPDRPMRIEMAPVKPNPFEALAGFVPTPPVEPQRASWWRQVLAWFRLTRRTE